MVCNYFLSAKTIARLLKPAKIRLQHLSSASQNVNLKRRSDGRFQLMGNAKFIQSVLHAFELGLFGVVDVLLHKP